jgi:hypothetical protein
MAKKQDTVGDVGDLTVESGPKGEYGIIEYTDALPRAKLYANWRSPTNDAEMLDLLGSQKFDPWQSVLIAANTPLPPSASATNADAGEVRIVDYHPKSVRLEANAKTPAVLLLNDRFGADWRVRVDGAWTSVLRCNYIMRGVYLTAGHHVVEFVFRPSLDSLYVSVSAIVIGIILSGYLIITCQTLPGKSAPVLPPPARPPPVPQPADALAKGPKGNGKAKRV